MSKSFTSESGAVKIVSMGTGSAAQGGLYVCHRPHPYRFVANVGWVGDLTRARKFDSVGDAVFALLTIGRPGDCVCPVLPGEVLGPPVWVMFDPAES
jgi:hypothetical protein